MAPILNIAAYRFLPLSDLKAPRARLQSLCKEWGLKGTILLSTEGINLFVAGAKEKVQLLLDELRSWPGLADLEVKSSETDRQPFRRMLVRIKKEIIAFGAEGIDPSRRTSPKLSAQELKRWLDEGRPVTLLDTRNEYEVKLGTFRNALHLKLDHFRNFPAAARVLPEALKEQPIVMFCTGGIRCEKAGPYLEREGFKHIHQLDGGILKYFEECGAAHYDGECFVFDQRVGVDASLQETASTQCFRCQTPLSEDEQRHAHYVVGEACQYCYKTTAEKMADLLARRHEQIDRLELAAPGEPRVNTKVRVLHEDEALAVLNKPAPLPMHAGGRFRDNTLKVLLDRLYSPQKPLPSHRLDANTTGVLVVARTRYFAGQIQPQFGRGEVVKAYLVRVQGHPLEAEFSCEAPIGEVPGKHGTRSVDPEQGLPAQTKFRVLRRLDDGTALLEAHPLTGRTNQIRIHLAHLGLPVCGDPAYLAGNIVGESQTLSVEDAPLCLHAWRIEFVHPLTREPVAFTAPPPAWMLT